MEILLDKKAIDTTISDLAARINRDYQGKALIVIGVLKGSIFFVSDLLRKILVSVELDFLEISSYEGRQSRGTVCVVKDIGMNIKNRDVLVVEDLIDTGVTLSEVKKLLLARKPRSLKIAVLLDKPAGRKVEIQADYVGKVIPDVFVVGYGHDFNGQYRNLPEIRVLEESQHTYE